MEIVSIIVWCRGLRVGWSVYFMASDSGVGLRSFNEVHFCYYYFSVLVIDGRGPGYCISSGSGTC